MVILLVAALTLLTGLPRSNDYYSPGQDMSLENIGPSLSPSFPMPRYSGGGGTTVVQSRPKSNIKVQKLPSGGYSLTGSGKKQKAPNVNIKTGNVTQFGGTNYVTTKDLQKAVQSGVAQTMNYIQAGGVKHYL